MAVVANIDLTEEQHQQLLDLLNRRFKKMTCTSLLELERLTRHPVELTGFQSVSASAIPAVPKTEPVPPRDNEAQQVNEEGWTAPVNRREFMLYGAAGLMGAILGYGWWKSDANADQLSGTLANVGQGVSHLEQNVLELQRMISTLDQEIAGFQNYYQPTLDTVAHLRYQVDVLNNQYQQLDAIGKAIADLLDKISMYAALFPEINQYAQQVNTMVGMVKDNIPAILLAAGEALDKLNTWFSNEGNQGINNRLLKPTASVFQMIGNEIRTGLNSINAELD